ncbi:MAG: DNA-processing protein DprA [Pseudomonadota bacterium]
MDRDELAAWLRLLETPGVGRESARRLLAAFGSPQAVFDAAPGEWRSVVPSAVAQALAEVPADAPALLDATWRWLQQPSDGPLDSPPHAVVCLGDADYPALWLQMADPPLMVYAKGRLDTLRTPAIAIVGSRNPTRQGLDNARAFAQSLSQHGLTVVSGLALGVDGAAHDGALAGPGRTVALVGTGLDRVYPRHHLALAQRIAEQGLLLSEYPLGTSPRPAHFPQRNRLIAGLGLGTLVIEATLQSGSLITARLAMECGREVLAIPGSIHAPQSRGCHALIKQGAKLVECAQDVLEELQWPAPGGDGRVAAASVPAAPPSTAAPDDDNNDSDGSGGDDPLLAALGHDPVGLEALAQRTGWSPQVLNVKLLTLELEGRVARLPGQLFQRIAHA